MIDQYLGKYAEHEVDLIKLHIDSTEKFNRVLVIPAYDEGRFIEQPIKTAIESAEICKVSLLLIVVINHKLNSSANIKSSSEETYNIIGSLFASNTHISKNKNFSGYFNKHKVIAVDRFSMGCEFGEKDGVGLARKIGCDIAYQAFVNGNLTCNFAQTSDGDASLPSDYFLPLEKYKKTHSALTYPFLHLLDDELDEYEKKALFQYEQFLHFYQRALTYSGSPYNHYSIGSTIAFNLNMYSKVRGFPKRVAGEDFYLLDKLRKLGLIDNLQTSPIKLRGRTSTRVPFGTGQSVQSISELFRRNQPYKIYQPKIFDLLRDLLKSCDDYCEHLDENKWRLEIEKSIKQTSLCHSIDTVAYFKLLDSVGITKVIQELPHVAKKTPQRKKRFADFFDGFKTLKFIHLLRDQYFPSLKAEEVFSSFQ